MPEVKVILALDYGRERVGVAIADGEGPRRLLTLHGGKDIVGDAAQLIGKYMAAVVVIGLPRNADGEDTAWTTEVRAFAQELTAATLAIVVLQDEFATSQAAAERLKAEHFDEKQRKLVLDQEAAVVLLEDYVREI